MNLSTSRRLAWMITSLGLFLTFAILIIGYRADFYSYNGEISAWYTPLIDVALSVVALLAGGLITTRLPGNRYGWIWILAGLGTGVIQPAGIFFAIRIVGQTPSGDILGGIAIYLAVMGWLLTITMLILSLLFFPTGQVPSPRWHWIAWVTAASAIAASSVSWAVPGNGASPIVNPLVPPVFLSQVAQVILLGATGILIFFSFPISVISLSVRYRRGNAVERTQIRWLAFAGAINLIVLFIDTTEMHLPWISEEIMSNISTLGLAALPLAVVIAILRYRLYDIDLFIRRTLQYGLLSVILGAIYYGMVVVFGQVIQGMTGQTSPAVIVVSTLVIAALFNPLRRRIQQVIDRRFFRQRYDADRTLEDFSSIARHETDLVRLSSKLVGTVQQSIQPESVELWIHNTEARGVGRKA